MLIFELFRVIALPIDIICYIVTIMKQMSSGNAILFIVSHRDTDGTEFFTKGDCLKFHFFVLFVSKRRMINQEIRKSHEN